MAGGDFPQVGLFRPASMQVAADGAARVELAPAGKRQRIRHGPRNGRQAGGVLAQLRHGFQQPERVRVPRPGKQRVVVRVFDDLGRIHHRDGVRRFGDDGQIVRNQQNAQAGVGLDFLEQVQDLRLDGDVEGGGRLVGDQQPRIAAQGHGDHDPLPHAAGHLVRILVEPLGRLGDVDPGQHLDREFACLRCGRAAVKLDRLDNLVAAGEHGIEAGHRLLEDDGNLGTAHLPQGLLLEADQLLSVEENLPPGDLARWIDQAQDRECGDTLSAAALTDQGERLGGRDIKADAVDGLDQPVIGVEVRPQVADAQQCAVAAHTFLSFGSRASRSRSPKMFKARTRMNMAVPAEASCHHRPGIRSSLARTIIWPQLGMSVTPRPR